MTDIWLPGERAPRGLPEARYVLPSFIERTSYGVKESNPYNKLFEERIIFLGVQIDDASANDVMAQLLCLESADPDREISMYINSPGGSFTALMAIFDTMEFVPCDVATFAMGMAASMGQFLLSAGARGKRYALPHARIMMHQPSSGVGGSESDIVIQAEQSRLLKRELAELIAEHTGQTVEKVTADSERDRWFRAQDALEYGFVDHVISRAGQLPDGDESIGTESNGNGSAK